MSKLLAQNRFFDVSDYGRYPAVLLVNQLKKTRITSIQVTLLFGITGLVAAYFILQQYFVVAGILIIFKSILDAADGELARAKKTPSFTGRYLDSIFDFLLNLVLLISVTLVTASSPLLTVLAFLSIQLQGTVYNYYYVILRNKSVGGDSTSRIFEYKFPKALPGENQKRVNVLFVVYTLFFGIFDRIVYSMDRSASKNTTLPAWFMTLISAYGLGFQLLIIAVMLNLHLINYIIPFLILYTIFVPVLIGIRKTFLRH
jgi:phosphatidylglycerophosphate synthase